MRLVAHPTVLPEGEASWGTGEASKESGGAMNPTDRRKESHSEAGFSGREGRPESARGDGSSKYGKNSVYKRERGDGPQDSDRERKKSRSRSPWEEQARGRSWQQGHSDPDLHEYDAADSRGSDRTEKRTRSEPSLREAGEIADERPRDPYRDSKRGRADDRHRSRHSREGSGLPPTGRRGNPSPGKSDRQRGSGRDRDEQRAPHAEQTGRSKTPLRLTGIPAEIRQAALEAQKREQARQAAAAASRAEEEGEAPGASSGSAQSKHTPIVWNGGSKGGPDARKSPRQIAGTAAELAALELEEFKRSQHTAGIDPDAPAAMKASPSVTGSADGEAPDAEKMEVDSAAAQPAGIKSRWLIEEEEEEQPPALSANGTAAQDAAEAEVLEELERQEGEAAAAEEWDTDDDEKSEFQATRREICMMNACRKVESYERLNRISEGTYGVVYRARDKETGVICALKRIKMEREREGFPLTSIREINILLSFQHPNIVDVSEVVVGDSLDQIYMVMEFMEHDLKGLMDDMTEPFTVAETKNLMQQLLEGMAYLHSNWVLHRDLKTSNILYNNRGQLKICDFGLARQYGSPLRPYTHNVVTLYYRAIELLLGCEKYSTAIDVWSLGCIMAELLTKRVLFDGNGELGQIDKIFKVLGTPTEETWPGYRKLPNVTKLKLVNQPRTLRSILPAASTFDPNSGLTEAGFDLIERMLALDPARRISCKDALEHTWFKEQPWPKDNALMPTYPTNKDGSSKASRQRVQRPPPAGEMAAGPNFASRRAEIGMLFGK